MVIVRFQYTSSSSRPCWILYCCCCCCRRVLVLVDGTEPRTQNKVARPLSTRRSRPSPLPWNSPYHGRAATYRREPLWSLGQAAAEEFYSTAGVVTVRGYTVIRNVRSTLYHRIRQLYTCKNISTGRFFFMARKVRLVFFFILFHSSRVTRRHHHKDYLTLCKLDSSGQ